MIGIEDGLAPRRHRAASKAVIAGNDSCLADARDRAWRAGRSIAVDHQPRITLRDQLRVEMLRQGVGDAGNTGVPGDMACQFVGRQPEIAEDARDQAAVMIRGQQERRAAGGIIFVDGRNIFAAEE